MMWKRRKRTELEARGLHRSWPGSPDNLRDVGSTVRRGIHGPGDEPRCAGANREHTQLNYGDYQYVHRR